MAKTQKVICVAKLSSSNDNSTLLFYQIEPLKNGAFLILPFSIARNS